LTVYCSRYLLTVDVGHREVSLFLLLCITGVIAHICSYCSEGNSQVLLFGPSMAPSGKVPDAWDDDWVAKADVSYRSYPTPCSYSNLYSRLQLQQLQLQPARSFPKLSGEQSRRNSIDSYGRRRGYYVDSSLGVC